MYFNVLTSSLSKYLVVDIVAGLFVAEQLIIQRDALINEIQCIKQQYADSEEQLHAKHQMALQSLDEQLRSTHQVQLEQGQGSPCHIICPDVEIQCYNYIVIVFIVTL